MRLVLLCSITMVAFAANSILNRLALANGEIDAVLFGVVRLAAGAAMLLGLVLLRKRPFTPFEPGRWIGVSALLVYIFGFSLAYQSLDAGLGALLLFGMVQLTMFGGAIRGGERPGTVRIVGAGIAFAGLVWLLLPGEALTLSLPHAALMAAAGIGWGVYSLNGRRTTDALGSTAANFGLAALIAAGLAVVLRVAVGGGDIPPTAVGFALAVASGAITSGLGYALWYHVLPQLRGSTAAVTQLTVPILAILGGTFLLGEPVTFRLIAASALVLGGVFLSVTARR